MKVLVCGDRNWTDQRLVERELSTLPAGTVIIQGGARGADTIAKIIAHKLRFPVIQVNADWDKFHRVAGLLRNQRMLDTKPDFVIAFHDNLEGSKGTKDMVVRSLKAGKPVRLVKHGEPPIDLHRAIPRWLSHVAGGRKAPSSHTQR